MKPQHTLGRATTPDGRELILYERDGAYAIRVDGRELMSSRAHGSEEALARLVLAKLSVRAPRILVGGLGMGYTLRAVLDLTPAAAEVLVAEILPAVVEWNRGHLADLARRPLEDPRVAVEMRDVVAVMSESPASFDAVLLDVDNGPAAFTTAANSRLYEASGLALVRRSLRRGGVLGVWSADPDPPFVRRLAGAGFRTEVATVPARSGRKGPMHTLFIAR